MHINNGMHVTAAHRAPFASQLIHSASAVEWITARTDPSLASPRAPLSISPALTFIEAFQRNPPPAIHFLKWSHREKKYNSGMRVRDK